MIEDTIYFWIKLLEKPIRLISWVIMMAAVWLAGGGIFHPIRSTIGLIFFLILCVGVTALISKVGYLQKIDWMENSHQSIATRGTLVFMIDVSLYRFWGYHHEILFTIVVAVIFVIVFSNVFVKFLKK